MLSRKEVRFLRTIEEKGPATGIMLVQQGFSPPFVYTRLRAFEAKGLVAKCDPPEGLQGRRADAAWFCLTLKGQTEVSPL